MRVASGSIFEVGPLGFGCKDGGRHSGRTAQDSMGTSRDRGFGVLTAENTASPKEKTASTREEFAQADNSFGSVVFSLVRVVFSVVQCRRQALSARGSARELLYFFRPGFRHDFLPEPRSASFRSRARRFDERGRSSRAIFPS